MTAVPTIQVSYDVTPSRDWLPSSLSNRRRQSIAPPTTRHTITSINPLLNGGAGATTRRRGSNALLAEHKVSLLNERRTSITSIGSGGFPERLARGRRQSMFARPYAPSRSVITRRPITCIPLIIRFRRTAKLVRILCRVFSICSKDLNYSLPDNNWVALKEALLRETNVDLKDEEKEKNGQEQYGNVDQKQTFDISKFRRASKNREAMPIKMKEILSKSPRLRRPDENANIRRMMQKLELFSRYPVMVQKGFSSCGWLEVYEPNRIILLKGHAPSCFYFVISGRLVSNGRESEVTGLLKKGDKFGEDEVITGDVRPTTVISQDRTELFVVHKKDYRQIMNEMGAKDAASLDICKRNTVFNHWPLEKLKKNPYSWNVQNYREGTLVVEDSSQCDWVYIIKSGSCKVIKCIRPYQDDDDPDVMRKLLAREAREKLLQRMSAGHSRTPPSRERNLPPVNSTSMSLMNKIFFTAPSRPQTCSTLTNGRGVSSLRSRSRPGSSFMSSIHGDERDQTAYVALDVLGHGDSFGFRSILPTEQRGPSVSLVSCGAEIIQINRKFFRKFADETTCSLIDMQFPPFPKRHVIMGQLRQLHQWEVYKRQTIDQIQMVPLFHDKL